MFLNGKDTGCSYFPNARVLKDIRSKPFYYSDIAKEKILKKLIDTSDIRKTLTYGEVDFGKSNIKVKGGKLYIIEGQNQKKQKFNLLIVNSASKTLLKDIEFLKED
jgi:hypothetical protein